MDQHIDRERILMMAPPGAGADRLRALVAEADAEATVESSVQGVIDRLHDFPAAFLLIDIDEADARAGREVAAMRDAALAKGIPIVLLGPPRPTTGFLQAIFEHGGVDYLAKPMEDAALAAKLRGVLEAHRIRERAKREAEQFRMIVQGTKDYAIFMLDPQGRVASWNAGAKLLKGYDAEEILGSHLSRFYPQDVVESGWVEHELRMAAAAGRFEDEGWRVRKDGSRFWANVVITALYDEHDELRGFAKVTRDLTSRKQAEEAARQLAEETAARRAAETNAALLAQERELLRVTLASIGDGVVTTDRHGRVTFMNAIAEGLTGWSQYDARDRLLTDVFQIVNDRSREPVDNPALRALEEGTVVGLANHTVLIARDRSEHFIDDSAAPIRDAGGKIVGSVLVFRDIGDRRRIERQRNARAAATQALATASAPAQAIEGVLAAICQNMGWNLGLFWQRDEKTHTLSCRQAWTDGKPQCLAFVEYSRDLEFARGVGLPGRVWSAGEPCWLEDFSTEKLPRSEPARKAGLHAAFGCPVMVEGELLGIVEFFSLRIEEPDTNLLEMATTVSGALGNFLERRRTEDALRQQTFNAEALSQRLNLALGAAQLGDWSWDASTDVVTFSERAAEIFGIAPGPVMTRVEMMELLHPEDRERTAAEVERVIAERAHYDVEYRVVRPDGEGVWVNALGRALYHDDGRVMGMYGVLQDIGERKTLEQSLKRAEQNARFLAAASATLAEIVDFDSTLQRVARLAVPSFADWAAIDVLGADGELRRVAVAHADDAKARLAREVQGAWHVLRTGQAELSTDTPGLRSCIGVPLRVRGVVRGVLSFVAAESGHTYDQADLDVAQELAHRTSVAIENAELYEELRQADREKDEFLATLAHELRNPLAPIRSGLHVFRLSGARDATTRQALGMMERQVEHLVRLVDDLLDVSRITRNRMELRMEPMPLADAIHSAVEASQPLIEKSRHTLSVALPPEPLHLRADRVRLAQVFANLLNNAARYTPPGGSIRLAAEREDDAVVVRVSDNGLGIPRESLATIFEMFAQVHRSQAGPQGGLGIGLTLVKRLLDLHGGSVEAHSEGAGQGSEFVVRLPLLDPARAPAPSSTPRASAAELPRRILIVDDNADAAHTLEMMLSLMGQEVRVAVDGPQALALAQQFHPEVVLLDIGLPKMSGYEVCRRLRDEAWARDTVIVAVTGWGQEVDRRRSKEAGFDEHLVKPVSTELLETILRRTPA